MTTETKQNDSKLVPEVQRQYSLLREFNLEQAQAGYEILSVLSPSYSYVEVIQEVKFKGVTSNLQEVFLEDKQGEGYCCGTQRIKMKPLCWLEGKPVYKGDKLWYKSKVCNSYYQHEAHCLVDNCLFNENGAEFVLVSSLSWYKPKELHVHQDLIEAYNKGAKVQVLNLQSGWVDLTWTPQWNEDVKYRIKPQRKSGWINLWKAGYGSVGVSSGSSVYSSKEDALAGLVFDGHLGAIEIHWEE